MTLSRVFSRKLVTASRSVPTCVLVALPAEERRTACDRTAAALRRRGIPAEVAPTPAKYGKQIRFADRRGIPFVWFPQDDGTHQVRDIRTGTQAEADLAEWTPPAADILPRIVVPT